MAGALPQEPPGGGSADDEADGTPDRLVEISLRDSGGRIVGHGSGWLLDEDLVLTAAHVVWPAARPHGGEVVIEVRCGNVPPYRPWHRCEIVWLGSAGPGSAAGSVGAGGDSTDPDAALLVVTGAGWRPPDPRFPPRLGSQGTAITEFEIFGFPAFLYTEQHAYDVHQSGGRLRPANLSRSEMRTVEVSAEDTPPSPAGWQGISGAAVLIEEQRAVIGVVVGSDQGDVRRLSVLPVTRLTSDPGFQRHWREHRQGAAHNRRKVLAAVRLRLERAEPLETEDSRRALLARLLPDMVQDPEIVFLDHGSVLAALVDRLAPRPDGFTILASAYAEAYQEDEATIGELCFLAEEFRALDVMGAEIWLGLRDALRKLVQDDLNGVPVPSFYAQAVEGRADTSLPARCDEPWKAFVRLLCVGTDTEQLRFLELLASAVGGSTADTVRQYNRRWAVQLDINRRDMAGQEGEGVDPRVAASGEYGGHAHQVDQLRRRLISAPVQRPTSARLLVELTPDPNSDPDRWTVSFYFQCRPRPSAWRRLPMPLAERVIPLNQLLERVESARRTLREVYGVLDGRIEIEYILPLELIDHPDRLIASGGLPHEAASFPLVVHSLDRLQNRTWRAVWQEHWRRTRRTSGELLFQVAALDQTDTVAAEPVGGVLLTEKPGSDIGRREVSLALRHGVPLVMWRHDPRAQPDFAALHRRIMAEGRLDVRHLGQDDGDGPASGGSGGSGGSLWNRHFVVIFDTPENLPGLVYGEAP
ncbi:hypothetical protein JHN63_31600 [Streptomyces sp. MBT65]|uniref:VMAP-C domain-containing protein n=1 Tax=Streptomyces sp. MBT65 TaxID=1488395 RepID=UPI00190CFC5F|nr:hypothetical protein [Streptomyces sp. MBT65]MBK3578271.1 hypothetical protein [Streptomyces sp. MBT65]